MGILPLKNDADHLVLADVTHTSKQMSKTAANTDLSVKLLTNSGVCLFLYFLKILCFCFTFERKVQSVGQLFSYYKMIGWLGCSK